MTKDQGDTFSNIYLRKIKTFRMKNSKSMKQNKIIFSYTHVRDKRTNLDFNLDPSLIDKYFQYYDNFAPNLYYTYIYTKHILCVLRFNIKFYVCMPNILKGKFSIKFVIALQNLLEMWGGGCKRGKEG